MGLRNPKLNIDWLRVEAGYYDLPEVQHDRNTGMIAFDCRNRGVLNVYTTTGTIVLKHRGNFKVTKKCSFDDVVGEMKKLS